MVWPAFSVVPMGWSHALGFCQRVLEGAVRRGAPGTPLLDEVAPATLLCFGVASVYVDNFAVLASNAEVARNVAQRVLREVEVVGLEGHEWQVGAGAFELLGLSLTPEGRVGPKPTRVCRLWGALDHALTRGQLTLHALSVLVGVFTSMCMLRRETLALLRAVYCFIGRGTTGGQPKSGQLSAES